MVPRKALLVWFLLTLALVSSMRGAEHAVSRQRLASWLQAPSRPVVVSNGDEWLMLFATRNAGLENALYATRLDSSGIAIDKPAIVVSREINFSSDVAAVWTGTAYSVFWPTSRGILSARIFPDGRVIRSTRPAVVGGWENPQVAWNGSVLLLVLAQATGLHAAVLDADHQTIRHPFLLAAPGRTGVPKRAATASDGEGFQVIWSDPDSHSSIFGVEVDKNGYLPDSRAKLIMDGVGGFPDAVIAPVALRSYIIAAPGRREGSIARALVESGRARPLELIETDHGRPWTLSLERAGSVVALTFSSSEFVLGARVGNVFIVSLSLTGERLSPVTALTHGASVKSDHKAAGNGRDLLVAWLENPSEAFLPFDRQEVRARVLRGLESPPVAEEGQAVGFVRADQILHASASSGDLALVVWREPESSRTDILYSSRIDRDGRPLDSFPRRIASVPRGSSQPALAFNGSDFLVVWAQDASSGTGAALPRGILGTRVRMSGEVVESTPFVLAAQFGFTPSVACDGVSQCLVLWRELDRIHGTRVSVDGEVKDPHAFEVFSRSVRSELSVVWGEGTYLVTWSDRFSCSFTCPPPPRFFTHAGFLSPEGEPLSELLLPPAFGHPKVVWGASQFLLLAGDRGFFLTAERGFVSEFALDVPPEPSSTSAVWTGAEFLVSRDSRPFGARDVVVSRVTEREGMRDLYAPLLPGTSSRGVFPAGSQDGLMVFQRDQDGLRLFSDRVETPASSADIRVRYESGMVTGGQGDHLFRVENLGPGATETRVVLRVPSGLVIADVEAGGGECLVDQSGSAAHCLFKVLQGGVTESIRVRTRAIFGVSGPFSIFAYPRALDTNPENNLASGVPGPSIRPLRGRSVRGSRTSP